MSLDAIKQVTETEQQTQERRLAAQVQAKKTVADAERAGREQMEAARAEAETQVRGFMKNAEDKASKHAAEVMEATGKSCQALCQAAEGRMAKASALIVRRVVNI